MAVMSPLLLFTTTLTTWTSAVWAHHTESYLNGPLSSKHQIYHRIASADYAIAVDITKNRAWFFKKTMHISSWDVLTGDTTGQIYYGGKHTPIGIYNIDLLDLCPPWYPSEPRRHYSALSSDPSATSPCGPRNPLGRLAAWFHKVYGIHSTSPELMDRLFQDVDGRRASRGCVVSSEKHMKEFVLHILQDDMHRHVVQEFVFQLNNSTSANNYLCLSEQASETYGLSCTQRTVIKDVIVVIHPFGANYFDEFVMDD